MTKSLNALFALVAIFLAGCTPFVIASNTQHFATDEYAFPLADGSYAVTETSVSSASVANLPGHVEITMIEKDGKAHTLIGGFIALKTPGHFIFQATDATEGGKPADKKAEESIYIPVHFAKTGQVDWLVGPKPSCGAQCEALFASSGFQIDGYSGWRAPKGLSRNQILSFYEALAPIVERNPNAWESVTAMRIGGT
ncbi:MAG: hypothetical protein Q7R40_20030 [Phaeospirillum sp.]|nr:hypothetical protein [Phaeospirillum sp.]